MSAVEQITADMAALSALVESISVRIGEVQNLTLLPRVAARRVKGI